ncbi:hypothetical protein OIE13_05865 [Streptosporangium sp. NBC_01810]|uniref:hypothetical protein n=1 Tax=Streptosporangium sp. NBC_01810 TaxID=2975951 RepID=UPI002DDB57D1|nr:hypothetical protein [Streptosporangium sp. NBC_01810]WSA27399.1 hypothetical protein OIE13_05865 [Streptosporangium sp. NBC_01810]
MTLRESARQDVAQADPQRVLAVFALLLGALVLFNRPFFAHLLGTWGPPTWVIPIATAVAALDYAVSVWRGEARTASGAVTAVGAALLLVAVLAWRLS